MIWLNQVDYLEFDVPVSFLTVGAWFVRGREEGYMPAEFHVPLAVWTDTTEREEKRDYDSLLFFRRENVLGHFLGGDSLGGTT